MKYVLHHMESVAVLHPELADGVVKVQLLSIENEVELRGWSPHFLLCILFFGGFWFVWLILDRSSMICLTWMTRHSGLSKRLNSLESQTSLKLTEICKVCTFKLLFPLKQILPYLVNLSYDLV